MSISSKALLWQKIMALDPICTGSLHEQYLPCGKPNCRCKDSQNPQRHGPYYLWIRHRDGKQVNRTLKPGPGLERVRQGIANYQLFQRYWSQLLQEEESRVLEPDRAWTGITKKNFRWKLSK